MYIEKFKIIIIVVRCTHGYHAASDKVLCADYLNNLRIDMFFSVSLAITLDTDISKSS